MKILYDLQSSKVQNIELSSTLRDFTHSQVNWLISTVKRRIICVEVLAAAGLTGECAGAVTAGPIANKIPEKIFFFQLFVEI